MKKIAEAIKYFADVILLITWIFIIANNLPYNYLLILISIIFVLFSYIGDTKE